MRYEIINRENSKFNSDMRVKSKTTICIKTQLVDIVKKIKCLDVSSHVYSLHYITDWLSLVFASLASAEYHDFRHRIENGIFAENCKEIVMSL